VVEAQDLPPPASRPVRRASRLLWFVLVACWIGLAGWAWNVYRQSMSPWPLLPPDVPVGTYQTVREIAGPISLRLDDRTLVRLAGLAEPGTPADAGRARARLAELAAPGTVVFVEIEPRAGGDDKLPAPASVFLPPEGAGQPLPFPYGRSRLLGQVLVQEGLARVNEQESYRYLNEFLLAEDDARRHRRGVWAGQ
jgi:hypothetical protein